MNLYKKLVSSVTGLAVAGMITAILGVSGNASALACYQYNPNGFTTSTTPVFNNICGITSTLSSSQGSYPLGDEPNFVRIRENTSGSPLGANNPELQNNITSACTPGEKFDVWTYIHNNAESQYNDNGSGSAVAHNVALATSAPINQVGNSFTFKSTVSASNSANDPSDTATLDCNGQPVKLELSAFTNGTAVAYNNNLNQTSYNYLDNSVVNGSTPIGSPNGLDTGTEWGCWDYRVVVVYEVTVVAQPTQPQVTAMCNFLNVEANGDRNVKITAFNYTAENATVKDVVINWGDNSAPLTINDVNQVVGQTHNYANYGTYNVSAIVNFNAQVASSGGPNTNCAENVTFTQGQPPVVTTTSSPSTPAAPTSLVNTGAGSVVGIFAAATAAGAVAYRRITGRKLSRQ